MVPKNVPQGVQVVETNGFDKLKEQRNEKQKYKDFSTFKI